jgi:hypothetical protein
MFKVYGTLHGDLEQKIFSLCDRKSLKYEFKDISGEDNLMFLYGVGITGDLPQIFDGDRHIGGFDAFVGYTDVVVSLDDERNKRKK